MDIVTTKVSMKLNRFSSRRFKMQKEKIILRERECLIITELRENDMVIMKLKNIGKHCIARTYTYLLSTNFKQYILNFLTIALCKYVSFSTIIHCTFDEIRKERNFCFTLV